MNLYQWVERSSTRSYDLVMAAISMLINRTSEMIDHMWKSSIAARSSSHGWLVALGPPRAFGPPEVSAPPAPSTGTFEKPCV